jgi:hypothetical protein
VFENRVLRRIFGTKRDGVTGGWRKLHNEKLHNLYSSLSIIRMITPSRMSRACSTHCDDDEEENACNLLVGKAEGRRPLGRPRHRWVGYINKNLVEIG